MTQIIGEFDGNQFSFELNNSEIDTAMDLIKIRFL